MTVNEQPEHKTYIKNLSSCEGVLESPKSLTQTLGEGQICPGKNPEKPNHNHEKETNDPQHGKQTDASM